VILSPSRSLHLARRCTYVPLPVPDFVGRRLPIFASTSGLDDYSQHRCVPAQLVACTRSWRKLAYSRAPASMYGWKRTALLQEVCGRQSTRLRPSWRGPPCRRRLPHGYLSHARDRRACEASRDYVAGHTHRLGPNRPRRFAESLRRLFDEVNAFIQEVDFFPHTFFPGWIGGIASCRILNCCTTYPVTVLGCGSPVKRKEKSKPSSIPWQRWDKYESRTDRVRLLGAESCAGSEPDGAIANLPLAAMPIPEALASPALLSVAEGIFSSASELWDSVDAVVIATPIATPFRTSARSPTPRQACDGRKTSCPQLSPAEELVELAELKDARS